MQDNSTSKGHAAELAVDGIVFKPIVLSDPVPLGRQLLSAGKLAPPDAYSLYAILQTGDFEDVRLDETFDLRVKGTERFIAFTGDRIFRFFANNREIKWGLETIDEAALRLFSGASDNEAVFLEVRGGTDRLITQGEAIDLTRDGVERFITAPRPKTYHFFVNGQKYETDQPQLTGLQIKARVSGWNPEHDLMLEGHGDDPDRIIADDEIVDLDVTPARRFSSVPKANFG